MSHSLPVAVALAGVLLVVPACSGGKGSGGAGGPPRPEPGPHWIVAVAADLDAPVEVAGARVPPGGQAAVYHEDGERTGVTSLGQLAGLPMEIVAGQLRIGEVGRGPLPEGSTLRLAPEGVFVDGEFRGPLPLP